MQNNVEQQDFTSKTSEGKGCCCKNYPSPVDGTIFFLQVFATTLPPPPAPPLCLNHPCFR